MTLPMVEVSCDYCGTKFTRYAGEHRRSVRLGRKSYCSRHCAGQSGKHNLLSATRVWSHLDAGNRRDQFTPLRYVYRVARGRALEFGKEFTITLADLLALWQVQDGKCPYTNWDLILPEGANSVKKPNNASLDRIDSAKGYIPGNIQFVSYMANVAKNSFTHEQMLEFCDAVAAKRAHDKAQNKLLVP